jgi:filamentous hemagglutinin family protein
MWRAKFSYILLYSISLVSFYSSSVLAQTVPDHTLGSESSTVNQDVTIGDRGAFPEGNRLVDLIEAGATRGNNLFHSFSEFNVGDGSAVYFASPDGIANILTRVTGNNPSEIFGTLGVDGAANLFLLNPNGIVFGENAALDLNGSFLATTADSYIFENDFAYSASNPNSPPLLTVNLPVRLQFGNQAEAIAVRGWGSNIMFYTFDPFPLLDFRTKGLTIHSGNTLALIGGEINLQGGNLTAPQGRVELASIAKQGNASLTTKEDGFTVDTQANHKFQDINLTQGASIDTSGNGGGNLQLQGANISLLNQSAIITRTLGDDNGGEIQIKAANSVNIIGANDNFAFGGIFNQVEVGATGKSGDLTIQADNLLLKDGGYLLGGNRGTGDGANLSVKATTVQIDNGGIYTPVISPEAISNGGNLTIDAEQLIVRDGGLIASSARGNGNAGNIKINAQQFKVDGYFAQISTRTYGNGNGGDITVHSSSVEINSKTTLPDFALSGLNELVPNGLYTRVEEEAIGNSGNVIIETDKLLLTQGGAIFANSRGQGNAGNIFIRANNLEVRDRVIDIFGTHSGISSTVEQNGIGNGGNVDIMANNLNLIDGGSILVNALGNGDAGKIKISAQNVDISGVSSGEPVFGIEQESLPSQISAFSQGDFDAGSININTDTLQISDRGNISVSNLGNGNSGNLNITAKELNLDNSATLEAKVNAGSQGNINLTTDNLFLSNNSEINVLATGKATGGNIKIANTDNIVLTANSRILANAIQGKGGNIEIMTQGYFVSGDSLVSASSKFGLDGNINVENINGDRPLELDQLPENLVDRTQQIAKSCGGGKN